MNIPEEVRAPRGTELSCKGWGQEAAMRMLMNNLDPDVAEKPQELVVYGGSGKAARNWDCFHKIVETLKNLENDETLLVQSGKPVGVAKTHPDAPRVLISNAMLVPKWADWETFRKLEAQGLTMFGQMTAGSWIYIGTQGILQGTYETFASAGRTHFDGDLRGRILLSAGLGGMGGAQPLATTMNGGVFMGIEVDRDRIQKRLKTGYLDQYTEDLKEAVRDAEQAKKEGKSLSIGVLGNAAEMLPALIKMGFKPDLLTDQTSAHDTLNGYVPAGIEYEDALRLRKEDPDRYQALALESIVTHVNAMLEYNKAGVITFDYGNNIRGQALEGGVKNAFDFPGFVPAYIRPLFCEGKGPFRWAALSGDPEDIKVTDEIILSEFSNNEPLCRWIRMAQEKVHFQGLPSRICWLGYGERAHFGELMNREIAKGRIKAPIVIGRDHLDSGSVASPNRETESMKDGSDAIADWPILNALLNAVSGATWVSVHHGGGVGIGYAIHAGLVIVADGTAEAGKRLQRVLTCDPGTGVMRHADAGYEKACEFARKNHVKIPFLE